MPEKRCPPRTSGSERAENRSDLGLDSPEPPLPGVTAGALEQLGIDSRR